VNYERIMLELRQQDSINERVVKFCESQTNINTQIADALANVLGLSRYAGRRAEAAEKAVAEIGKDLRASYGYGPRNNPLKTRPRSWHFGKR